MKKVLRFFLTSLGTEFYDHKTDMRSMAVHWWGLGGAVGRLQALWRHLGGLTSGFKALKTAEMSSLGWEIGARIGVFGPGDVSGVGLGVKEIRNKVKKGVQ